MNSNGSVESVLIKHAETLLRTKDCCTHSLLHAQQDALTQNKDFVRCSPQQISRTFVLRIKKLLGYFLCHEAPIALGAFYPNWGSFSSGESAKSVRLITHFLLVPRLTMCGATPPFPNSSSRPSNYLNRRKYLTCTWPKAARLDFCFGLGRSRFRISVDAQTRDANFIDYA
jgi:hypothetical protein